MTMRGTMWRGVLGGSRVIRLPPRSPAARIMARTFPYVTALPAAARLLRERAKLHGAPWADGRSVRAADRPVGFYCQSGRGQATDKSMTR
jgi:hypothetical protein